MSVLWHDHEHQGLRLECLQSTLARALQLVHHEGVSIVQCMVIHGMGRACDVMVTVQQVLP